MRPSEIACAGAVLVLRKLNYWAALTRRRYMYHIDYWGVNRGSAPGARDGLAEPPLERSRSKLPLTWTRSLDLLRVAHSALGTLLSFRQTTDICGPESDGSRYIGSQEACS